ncbi:MAG: DEAD/DEAH box helicase family protein [Ignavibacteriae bacterium]|nr:DEAD/DEAH box helicase family protein [Ignavibacteriota bacterium]
MLNNIINIKKNEWLNSNDCTAKSVISYIRNKGELREPQIQAIETYLFLKIRGENKPLWKLFSEGFFINNNIDLSRLNINQAARERLSSDISALALYDYSKFKINGSTLLPELEKLIIETPNDLDYLKFIKSIFYNVDYSDFLFSLPMGAGKTFLMSAFIYLDLYFAALEPANKIFAHNFLVLVPSGLKSSIVPSLKTIEHFNPNWVLPEPSACEIKKLLKFEVLDQPKTAKKSNKARNPNAQKVNQYISDDNLFGLVMVVNAEKVILDRLDLTANYELIEKSDDEKDRLANELRNIIGKIPNLQLLIDEVHHASLPEIKLRQKVNQWHSAGNITSVLGFSGTPYLSSPDKLTLGHDSAFKFYQITNTVYYYPLVSAIKTFLKNPTVKIAQNLTPLQIIEKGVRHFYEEYQTKVYKNGCIAKLAIYCGNIERLETEIYPAVSQLIREFGDSEENILKFHKGNKIFILLVQVGKEGWDCRSLTGIILSQKGDSPSNMVLQTSCRCLREVDKGQNESAVIWLNDHNAKILNRQLKETQHTSIEELNSLSRDGDLEYVERFSRMSYLDIPPVDFYQMKINYKALLLENSANTNIKLKSLYENIDKYKSNVIIDTQKDFFGKDSTSVSESIGNDIANFEFWLADISKQSLSSVSFEELLSHKDILLKIFESVTYKQYGYSVFNDTYNISKIESQIRLAFSVKRSLETNQEIVPQNADLLIAEKLFPFEKNSKFYPWEKDRDIILNADLNNADVNKSIDYEKLKELYNLQKDLFKNTPIVDNFPLFEEFIKQFDISLAVKSKDFTFHYLPYNFIQSGFEMDILKEILTLDEFKERKLEVYYNGERGLTGFVLNCFSVNGKGWKFIGRYTPDFLIIKRNKKKIHKILIVETKGEGYSADTNFIGKKKYVETEFLRINKEKFKYNRFDFLYLEDKDAISNNLSKINNRIKNYFND